MKTGMTLVELAQELDRQSEAKRDYIAPVPKLRALAETVDDKPVLTLNVEGQDAYPLTRYAHRQMASYLDIPQKYYDRMVDNAPGLAAITINRWFDDHKDEQRLVRTLDGQARALLSDRYRCMEHADMAEAILPVLQEVGVQLLSCAITETRMYLKVVDESIQKELPTGRRMGDGSHYIFDTVSPGLVISNSEIGAGSLQFLTSIYTQACTNLMTFGTEFRKYHSGTRADISDDVQALLRDETKEVSDRALWMQAQDITRGAFDEVRFQAATQKLVDATEQPITDSPVKVVERAAKRFAWTEGEQTSVLTHLIQGGNLTQYGLHAAVTRSAEDAEDYDRASRFERQGGQVIDLNAAEWQTLAVAA